MQNSSLLPKILISVIGIFSFVLIISLVITALGITEIGTIVVLAGAFGIAIVKLGSPVMFLLVK